MTQVEILKAIDTQGCLTIPFQEVESYDFFCQNTKISTFDFFEIIEVLKERNIDYIQRVNPYFNPCKILDWCIDNGVEVTFPFPTKPVYHFYIAKFRPHYNIVVDRTIKPV